MKRISIYNSSKFAIIDDEDFSRCQKHTWYILPTGYIHTSIDGYTLYLHRFIMGLKKGDKQQVDHKNLNKLDFRKTELRICTPIQNQANLPKHKNSTSKFKGVYWHSCRRRWMARIHFKGITYYLGSFVFPENAAKAYDKKAKEFSGDFARINFV